MTDSYSWYHKTDTNFHHTNQTYQTQKMWMAQDAAIHYYMIRWESAIADKRILSAANIVLS